MEFIEKTRINGSITERGIIRSIQEWFGILNQFKEDHHKCETNCYIPFTQI